MKNNYTKLDKQIILSIRNLTAGAIYAYAESKKQSTGSYPSLNSIIEHFKINDLDKHAAVKELRRLNLLQEIINNKGL